jgi:hypothetical protein
VKLPRPSLATWWALAFVAIFVAAVLLWEFTHVAHDWMPNFGVEALAIAATITIVERIIRREASDRLRPRAESTMRGLRVEFRQFLSGVTIDYAGTHLHSFRPLARDSLAFLDQWLADKDAQDACQARTWDEERNQPPLVVHQGVEFAKALRAYRELDREVMEPELVRAIDDYLWLGSQHGLMMYGLSRDATGAERAKRYALAETAIVRQGRAFGEVLLRQDPNGPLKLDDLTLSAMQEHSENLRRGRWEWFADQRADFT